MAPSKEGRIKRIMSSNSKFWFCWYFTQVFICSLSSSWFQVKLRGNRTPVSLRGHVWTHVRDNKRLVLIRCWVCVTDSATYENQPLIVSNMGSNMTTWGDRCSAAESMPSLQEPKEPLQPDKFTKDDMEGLLSFLKLPLSYGHEEFKQHWPHTPHEANLVIESLRDLAHALLFGPRKDDAIVASFLEKRGLSILVEALRTVSIPEIIHAQAWQSLSAILLNVK